MWFKKEQAKMLVKIVIALLTGSSGLIADVQADVADIQAHANGSKILGDALVTLKAIVVAIENALA